MAIVRILQAGDIHQEGDGFAKYEQLKKVANEQEVDLVALLGDLFYQQDMEYAMPALKELEEEVWSELNEKDIQYLQTYATVKQIGGIDLIKHAIESGHEQSAQLEQLVKVYESSADPDATAQRINTVVQRGKEIENKIGKDVLKNANKRYQKLDAILAEFDMPVFGVRGNWELDTVYNMKNVKWMEKEDQTVMYKGLTFAGATNWYERLANLPASCYEDVEPEAFQPQSIAQLIQQYGTEDELKAYVEKAKAGDVYAVPDCVKPHLAVYQRLKNVNADVFLMHKGPGKFSHSEEGKPSGSGIGLELAMNELKPSIVLNAHFHSPAYDDSEGFQGLRGGDKFVYINHVDTDTKKIVGIDVYEWDKEQLVHKGYQDLTQKAEEAYSEAA